MLVGLNLKILSLNKSIINKVSYRGKPIIFSISFSLISSTHQLLTCTGNETTCPIFMRVLYTIMTNEVVYRNLTVLIFNSLKKGASSKLHKLK